MTEPAGGMEGFVRVTGPYGTAIVRTQHAEALDRALAGGTLPLETIRDASVTRGAPRAGRGAVARAALGSGLRVVVRKVRRGGLAGRLRPGRFAGERRILEELRVTDRAERAGLPVAAAVGAVLRPASAPVAGWVVTREIEGAVPLSELLARGARGVAAAGATGPGGADAAALRAGCARLVKRCHDAGLVHADLNLGNVLAGPSVAGLPAEGRDGGRAFSLVDLDRSRWMEGGADAAERFRALSRLARSHEKLFGPRGPWGPDALGALIADYAGENDALAARLSARKGRHALAMVFHRAAWRLTGSGSRGGPVRPSAS